MLYTIHTIPIHHFTVYKTLFHPYSVSTFLFILNSPHSSSSFIQPISVCILYIYSLFYPSLSFILFSELYPSFSFILFSVLSVLILYSILCSILPYPLSYSLFYPSLSFILFSVLSVLIIYPLLCSIRPYPISSSLFYPSLSFILFSVLSVLILYGPILSITFLTIPHHPSLSSFIIIHPPLFILRHPYWFISILIYPSFSSFILIHP